MTPKISIVFTSYNHREFLIEALDSLVNQVYKDFELIIIDDCSTDGSQVLLRRYEKDSRVKLILLEKNTGSYVHSSNLGASKAIADYIIFAQCDDFAEATQLEKLYFEMTNNNKVGVVFSSSKMINQAGNYITCDFDNREKKFKKYCTNNTLVSGLLMRRFLTHSCVIPNLSAALIKRSLFVKLNGLSSDYYVLADWDFWLKMTLECDFFYIREPLNNFRQHETTIRNTVKLNRQVNEMFEMFYSFFHLAQIGIIKQIMYEFSISQIWIIYFWSGKEAWVKSFFLLQFNAVKKSFTLPIVFYVTLLVYPILVIRRRISRLI